MTRGSCLREIPVAVLIQVVNSIVLESLLLEVNSCNSVRGIRYVNTCLYFHILYCILINYSGAILNPVNVL